MSKQQGNQISQEPPADKTKLNVEELDGIQGGSIICQKEIEPAVQKVNQDLENAWKNAAAEREKQLGKPSTGA